MNNQLNGFHMNPVIENCHRIFYLLDMIEQSERLSIDQMSALQKDRESIQTLLELISEAKSKQQIRDAWVWVNEIKHYYGGYNSGDLGKNLTQSFDLLWQNVLAML